MRKCSSFMCILVVLLAGGAEAQRIQTNKTAAWVKSNQPHAFSPRTILQPPISVLLSSAF